MVNLAEMDVSLYPAAVKAQLFALEAEYKAVSYTHLTLPTIYSV